MKGKLEGTVGRGPFNGVMERVAVPQEVTFEAATIRRDNWLVGQAGAGPEEGPRSFTHMAAGSTWEPVGRSGTSSATSLLSANTDAFIPDYRLAPEYPFPAAVRDLEACYRGLVDQGVTKVALTGDSAGGDLAQALLLIALAESSKGGRAPVGAVVFSPITDLALTGESFDTRAEAELYVTKPQAAGFVRSYLGETNPKNPLASPLYGDLSGLPPIRVHVGNDEVLLEQSHHYVEQAVTAGVDAKLDVWIWECRTALHRESRQIRHHYAGARGKRSKV